MQHITFIIDLNRANFPDLSKTVLSIHELVTVSAYGRATLLAHERVVCSAHRQPVHLLGLLHLVLFAFPLGKRCYGTRQLDVYFFIALNAIVF